MSQPKFQILKRPTKPNEKVNNYHHQNKQRPNGYISYEERSIRYAEARRRILGSEFPLPPELMTAAAQNIIEVVINQFSNYSQCNSCDSSGYLDDRSSPKGALSSSSESCSQDYSFINDSSINSVNGGVGDDLNSSDDACSVASSHCRGNFASMQ